MLDRESVEAIIRTALETLNEEREPDERLVVGPDTKLFGVDAELDSLSLVSVVVDVEEAVSDAVGRSVLLTDDRAMSRAQSPFADVASLTDYVVELLGEPA